MKRCSKCQFEKPRTDFYHDRRAADGLQSQCKACHCLTQARYREAHREQLRSKSRQYYLQNRPEVSRKNREWAQANPDKCRTYVHKWRTKNPTYNTTYYSTHLENERSRRARYAMKHPARIRAKNRHYQATKLQRTPAWLADYELHWIELVYKAARCFKDENGKVYHVDHIYPLQGATCSGLHVPWNLNLLPAAVNCGKHNKTPGIDT